MPFTCSDRSPKRFDGDFVLGAAPGYTPTVVEQAYIAKLEEVLKHLDSDCKKNIERDPNSKDAKTIATMQFCVNAVRRLRRDADEFISGKLMAAIATDNVLVIKGQYKGARNRLDQRLFTVAAQIDPATGMATDLAVRVNSDLPGQENLPPPEKQALFNAIAMTNSVMVAVHHRTTESAERNLQRGLLPTSTARQKINSANRLLDEFVRKLAGVGEVGLQGPHADLAKLALNDLRGQYVSRVAAGIKNNYVRSLGKACLVAAVLLLAIYVGIKLKYGFLESDYWQGKKNFFVLAAGGAIGTWLSFSIRRVTLAFEDLAVLEEDLLDPSLRVAFVVGLTSLVGLLFWTGAVNLEIGNLKTATFKNSGSISLLAGAFCGIAERALATAISGRAAAFVKGVAGG